MKRSNWLKNTIGAILIVPLFAALAGCGGGTTGVSDTGGGGGGGTPVSVTSTTLLWDAPLLNADGTTATDLAGYKLYYGKASGSYSPPTDIGNVTSKTIEGLTPGTTYYFSITAYDAAGNESAYAPEVYITI